MNNTHKPFVSLETLVTELKKHVIEDAEPRNEAEDIGQQALETARLALNYGCDTEYARTVVLKALKRI